MNSNLKYIARLLLKMSLFTFKKTKMLALENLEIIHSIKKGGLLLKNNNNNKNVFPVYINYHILGINFVWTTFGCE